MYVLYNLSKIINSWLQLQFMDSYRNRKFVASLYKFSRLCIYAVSLDLPDLYYYLWQLYMASLGFYMIKLSSFSKRQFYSCFSKVQLLTNFSCLIALMKTTSIIVKRMPRTDNPFLFLWSLRENLVFHYQLYYPWGFLAASHQVRQFLLNPILSTFYSKSILEFVKHTSSTYWSGYVEFVLYWVNKCGKFADHFL